MLLPQAIDHLVHGDLVLEVSEFAFAVPAPAVGLLEVTSHQDRRTMREKEYERMRQGKNKKDYERLRKKRKDKGKKGEAKERQGRQGQKRKEYKNRETHIKE